MSRETEDAETEQAIVAELTGTTPPKGVAHRTTRGAVWLVGSRLLARGIDFVTLMILAAVLSPADFGLVAIAMTLIFIVESVLDLPLSQSLVRLPEITASHLDTAFTIGAGRGLVLAFTISILAMPFANFYSDKRLLPMILVLAIAPMARGLQSPAMATFARNIDFRRDFIAEVSGKLISLLIAATIAITTRSYWAIVFGTVASPLMLVIGSYIMAPYKPRLSLYDWRLFAAFLGWTSAAQAVGAFNWQCDKLLLGRFVSRSELGSFSMASDLAALPDQALVKPIMRPLMAGFVTVRDDRARLQTAYHRASGTLLAFALPALIGLSVLAGPLVRILLGEKWAAAVPALQFLALTPIFSIWTAPMDPLAMALNRTPLFLYQNLIELAVKLPLVLTGIVYEGVTGAVFARLITAVIMMFVTMIMFGGLIKLSVKDQIVGQLRIIVSGLGMAMFLFFVRGALAGTRDLYSVISLIVVGLSALSIYLALLMSIWLMLKRPQGVEAVIAGVAGRLISSSASIGRNPPSN